MDVSPRSPATAAPGRTVSMIANANCWSGHDRNALNEISFEKPSELKKVTSHKTFNKLSVLSQNLRIYMVAIGLVRTRRNFWNYCEWKTTVSKIVL